MDDSLIEIATTRWLKMAELLVLLHPTASPLPLSTTPPTSPPQSGTLLLYDKRKARGFRVDGHTWQRKKDGVRVREDHVKLRLPAPHCGYGVNGYYARSATRPTMYRRIFNLTAEGEIAAKGRISITYISGDDLHSSSGDGAESNPVGRKDIVLVHYLDTIEAMRAAKRITPCRNDEVEVFQSTVRDSQATQSNESSEVTPSEIAGDVPTSHSDGKSSSVQQGKHRDFQGTIDDVTVRTCQKEEGAVGIDNIGEGEKTIGDTGLEPESSSRKASKSNPSLEEHSFPSKRSIDCDDGLGHAARLDESPVTDQKQLSELPSSSRWINRSHNGPPNRSTAHTFNDVAVLTTNMPSESLSSISTPMVSEAAHPQLTQKDMNGLDTKLFLFSDAWTINLHTKSVPAEEKQDDDGGEHDRHAELDDDSLDSIDFTKILDDDDEDNHSRAASREQVASWASSSCGAESQSTSSLFPRELLPEVASFSPSSASCGSPIAGQGPTVVEIVLSGPLPSSSWSNSRLLFVAFVDVGTQGEQGLQQSGQSRSLSIERVELAPLELSTRVRGKCCIPMSGRCVGCRRLVIVSIPARLCTSETNSTGVARQEMRSRLRSLSQSVLVALQASCDEALSAMPREGKRIVSRPVFFVPEQSILSPVIMPASQLSSSSFRFIEAKHSDDTQEYNSGNMFHEDILSPRGSVFPILSRIKTLKSFSLVRAVSLVFSVPRFDQRCEKAERDSMSFEEMSAALRDVHGTLEPRDKEGVGTDSTVVANPAISVIDNELNRIPKQKKVAWLLAEQNCPELVCTIHKMYFILANKGPDNAAEKLCLYWEMRLEFFEEKAFLPMTLDGALKDDRYTFVSARLPFVLPGIRDSFGRSVIYFDPSFMHRGEHDRKSVMRCLWYIVHAYVLDKTEDQISNGVVFIVNFGNFTADTVMRPDISAAYLGSLQVLPLIIRAIHYVRIPFCLSPLLPILKRGLGRKLRQRLVLHGSADYMASLRRYGILSKHLPEVLGGDVKVDVVGWLNGRLEMGL